MAEVEEQRARDLDRNRRVIKVVSGARQTIREKLPERFQSAEYLYEHGMVDQVVPRGELAATLARILSLLREPLRADATVAARIRGGKVIGGALA